jgi:hypothetical protein
MGFDNNEDQPLIHPRRWGSKVNLVMALGIVIFLILGVLAMHWMRSQNK